MTSRKTGTLPASSAWTPFWIEAFCRPTKISSKVQWEIFKKAFVSRAHARSKGTSTYALGRARLFKYLDQPEEQPPHNLDDPGKKPLFVLQNTSAPGRRSRRGLKSLARLSTFMKRFGIEFGDHLHLHG